MFIYGSAELYICPKEIELIVSRLFYQQVAMLI